MMKRFGLLVAAVSLAFPDSVFACRCKQRNLDDYFRDAAVVFLGRAVTT